MDELDVDVAAIDLDVDVAAIDLELARLTEQLHDRDAGDELAVVLDWAQIDSLLERRHALINPDE